MGVAKPQPEIVPLTANEPEPNATTFIATLDRPVRFIVVGEQRPSTHVTSMLSGGLSKRSSVEKPRGTH